MWKLVKKHRADNPQKKYSDMQKQGMRKKAINQVRKLTQLKKFKFLFKPSSPAIKHLLEERIQAYDKNIKLNVNPKTGKKVKPSIGNSVIEVLGDLCGHFLSVLLQDAVRDAKKRLGHNTEGFITTSQLLEQDFDK
jgi:hypothetical protein